MALASLSAVVVHRSGSRVHAPMGGLVHRCIHRFSFKRPRPAAPQCARISSWPRERTRTKLEEVLRWPPGTIARLRHGESVAREDATEVLPADDEVSLIAQAVVTAVHSLGAAIETLPAVDHPDFTPRVTAILSDLRKLEGVAARATRISKVTPPLIKALSTVRRRVDELTMLGATAPGATLGQRLYATRRRANLTIAETAQAAGVSEEIIGHAEAEEPVPADAVRAIESLIEQLD